MLRILLVEDDRDVREALAGGLRDAGHDVTAIGDGAIAMERIAAQPYDVLVTDVRLPKVDGLTLFRRARRVACDRGVRDDLVRERARRRRRAAGGRA